MKPAVPSTRHAMQPVQLLALTLLTAPLAVELTQPLLQLPLMILGIFRVPVLVCHKRNLWLSPPVDWWAGPRGRRPREVEDLVVTLAAEQRPGVPPVQEADTGADCTVPALQELCRE